MTDCEINAFLGLLKNKFKNINGLEDPLLFSSSSFIFKKTDNFIRVLLSRGNHWVCLYGDQSNEVKLFDSLVRSKIDYSLGEATKNMLRTDDPIIFNVQSTQIQKYSVCGHYALAFATSLCFNIDPEKIYFCENNMIEHYIDCLKTNEIKMYPHFTKKNSDKKIKKLYYF